MDKEHNIQDLLSTELMTYRIDMGMAQQLNKENVHVLCINRPPKIGILETVEGIDSLIFQITGGGRKQTLL